MKDKFLLFFSAWFFVQTYSCQVNTTDTQVSESSLASKKNGFFIKKYDISSTTDKNIILEDAWLEYIWFNESSNSISVEAKDKEKSCQLCFKLQQNSRLKYKVPNYLDWVMEYKLSEARVGIKFSRNFVIYNIEFLDCNAPDTIVLDLIERKDINSEIKETKVGTLIFKAINLKKK